MDEAIEIADDGAVLREHILLAPIAGERGRHGEPARHVDRERRRHYQVNRAVERRVVVDERRNDVVLYQIDAASNFVRRQVMQRDAQRVANKHIFIAASRLPMKKRPNNVCSSAAVTCKDPQRYAAEQRDRLYSNVSFE